MASDPQVDLIFSHFTPRYVATGVDPNDLASAGRAHRPLERLVPDLVRGGKPARGARRGGASRTSGS